MEKQVATMCSTWTSVRPFIQYPKTFLILNWRNRALMDGLLDGKGIGCVVVSGTKNIANMRQHHSKVELSVNFESYSSLKMENGNRTVCTF